MAPTPESIDSIEPSANDKPAARTPENVINNKKSYSNQAFIDDELNNGIRAVQHTKVIDAVNNASDHLDFDDILPHVGEFGRYQKILFFLMIPFAFFVAFVYFTQIFMTLVPERHWCRIPELDHLSVDQRLDLGIPLDASSSSGHSRCLMYDVNYTQLLIDGIKQVDLQSRTVPCKNGWEFDLIEVPYTTISMEQEWVCDRAALPSFAQSIFFCGAIVGGLLFGIIADRYGRIPALIATNVIGFLGGISTTFSYNFLTFALSRFVIGFAFDNCFTMMYILVLEYVGPKWRTFVANMSIAIFFTIAACLIPWIAYWLKSWQMLSLVTSVPLCLAIFTPWLIPESARWLVSQGRIDEAISILRKFERINKTNVPPELYTKFEASCVLLQQQDASNNSYSILDLFKTPRLRQTTILFILIWMAISLAFDGHVRNAGALGLDVFVTFTIAAATEMPADVLLTFSLDYVGRRWYAFGSMVLSGIFSLLSTVFPVGIYSALMAIIGRFWINISYNIGLQYVAEVLPTVVRAQGVAFVHIMGYVASIVAPFVVYLSYIHVTLPLIILGIVSIVGGFLCLFLPETLDKELPQSLEDGEAFGLDQRFWEFPWCKQNGSSCGDVELDGSCFKRSHAAVNTGISLRASSRAEFGSSMIQRHSSIRRSATQKHQCPAH